MCQVLLAEKDAALAALAQRLAQLEVGQGARAQLEALDARSARLRVRARAKGYVLQGDPRAGRAGLPSAAGSTLPYLPGKLHKGRS